MVRSWHHHLAESSRHIGSLLGWTQAAPSQSSSLLYSHPPKVTTTIPKSHYRLLFVATYTLFYKSILPSFFQNDAFVLVNLSLFAVSCGYLATLGLQYGTGPERGDQGLAGTIMGFHITFGISVGSLIAWLGFS